MMMNFEIQIKIALFSKDISGNPIIADLTNMPHLLIAGQRVRKSVGVNSMIISLPTNTLLKLASLL